MRKMFNEQIGRNIKVYLENMLVKSKIKDHYLDDLQEMFKTLRPYNMMLNLTSVYSECR